MEIEEDFNPEDFYKIAENIYNKLNTSTIPYKEAWIRTAISRLYYSIFLYLRNMIGYKKYHKRDIHQIVSEILIDKGGLFTKIGYKLSEIREIRNTADYDTDKTVSLELLEHVITTVNDMFEKARKTKYFVLLKKNVVFAYRIS